jgi:hypothetical protein
MRELTRERVVSKLMLDMVCLVDTLNTVSLKLTYHA